MNHSLLILADFVPKAPKNSQTIGLQDIDLEKLFDSSTKNGKTTYLYVHPDIKDIFKKITDGIKTIFAAGGVSRKTEKVKFYSFNRLTENGS
ncbi:hypothetical protein [Sphingobacterium sp. T2]|uniref:hypothetical protein n=1 Tax=Sphingobacterium sp. T2 TaxID=1590596 RepID=UPI000A88319B|nr:hypothetical protein [Sphingobacterium sp. T2]